MWTALILSGTLHGLIFLPVALSLLGGPGYVLEDNDEEWISRIARPRDYDFDPFQDVDHDSDED